MKKILLTSALALAVAAGASAKTADELRVYINPGHGSWTGDDRPCTLVGHGAYSRTNTDTLSFFESNTNLRKGFGVLERLREYGLKYDPTLNQTGERWQIGAARDMSNNIVMSHVKCGPYEKDNATANQLRKEIKAIQEKAVEENRELTEAEQARIAEMTEQIGRTTLYNRNLSEICAEVDANNFDMFISIHSNAANEGTSTNYPLFLYRGYDDLHAATGVTSEHQTQSRKMADIAWPYAYGNKYGNWTAYASSKNLRGDVNFYGSGTTGATGAFGYLGVLKHHVPGFLVEGYFHTYQPARHRAMNFDVCRVEGDAYAHGIADYFGIQKEKTGVIYGVVRDQNEKFRDAAYSPNPTTEDAYLPINGATVVLKKGGEKVAEYTTDNYYNGAYVFRDLEAGEYTIEVSHPDYNAMEPVTVTVTECGLAQPTVSIVNKDWVPPTVVYENYPDPVNNPAFGAGDQYNFNQTYVDEPVAQLEGKVIRRVIARNDRLYILGLSTDEKPVPTVIVYDAANKAVLAEVSTEGATGSRRDISDIQVTADGVLVACNESLNHYSDDQVAAGETRGRVRVYRWENDENGLPAGNPVEMFNNTLSGNFYRANVGHTMAYSGTLADGKIVVPAVNASDVASHKIFFNIYTILDGELAAANFNNKDNDGTYYTSELLGDNFTFTTSPDDKDAFITHSSKMAPRKAQFNNIAVYTDVNADAAGQPATAGAFFRYAGHNYMTVADNTADGKNVGVRLVDMGQSMTDAKQVATTNTAIAESAANVAVAGQPEADLDDEGIAKSAYMTLFAVRDGGKVSRFTTRGADQPKIRKEFAYGLKLEGGNDGIYTVTYSLTGDVPAASLVLTPANGDEAVVYTLSDLTAGEHTYVVDATSLEENMNYTWAVEVQNPAIAQSMEYSSDNNGLSNIRGGVAVFTDPEYDSFGYVGVVHGGNRGVDIYNPAGEKIASRVQQNCEAIGGTKANSSSAMRAATRGNEMLLASWGDSSHGVTAMDITDPDAGVYSVFEGTMAGSGLISNGGVGVGSGTPGVGFYNDGENSVMYTFDEDLANNKIVRYDIGSAKTWGAAPSKIIGQCGLANTNVGFIAMKDGVFASQVRGTGNNSPGCPGFEYLDKEGNILFQSSSIEGMNSCTSAIAVSADGKTMAVGEIGKVGVYDLTWNNNVPQYALRYKFAVASGNEGNMYFDYAGNLHYYLRANNGYHVYSLHSDADKVSTPAKAAYIIKGGQVGVENIAVDSNDSDAEAIYYNLNGVRVASDNLVPGVYVKVQGDKATKVVVR